MSKQENNSISDKASGFLSHLIELRDRLLRAVIVVGVAFVVLFPFAKNIYNWLAAPLVNQGQEMLIIGPVAPFLIPMKLTLMVAFLIALPYLFYQLWAFVAPGLYKHEKRLVYPLLASSILLFYLGILFVYYILLPMMFKIIPQFAPDIAQYSPDIAQYLDFTMMMFIAFGFGFEMPIATILLISTGMTTAKDLRRKRPYVIVGAFVMGMLLTPPDVISQVMLAIPMWLLFELGLIFSKFFKARIREAGEARDNMNDNTPVQTATAGGAAALGSDRLWEDEDYYYEETQDDSTKPPADKTSHDELSDEERSILDQDPLDDSKYDDEYDDDDFQPLTDEEMEAELDRIEADEEADEEADDTPSDEAEESNNKDQQKE